MQWHFTFPFLTFQALMIPFSVSYAPFTTYQPEPEGCFISVSRYIFCRIIPRLCQHSFPKISSAQSCCLLSSFPNVTQCHWGLQETQGSYVSWASRSLPLISESHLLLFLLLLWVQAAFSCLLLTKPSHEAPPYLLEESVFNGILVMEQERGLIECSKSNHRSSLWHPSYCTASLTL